MPFETFAAVAKAFGQVATGHTAERGERIEFLARVFSPGVWSGSPHSTCDIVRTLGKFSLTHRRGLRPSEIAYAKAVSLLHSDAATPLVGPLAQAIFTRCSLAGLREENIDPSLFGWFSRPALQLSIRPEVAFPNSCHEYAEEAAAEVELSKDFFAWLAEPMFETSIDAVDAWLARAPTAPPKLHPVVGDLDGGNRVNDNVAPAGMQPASDNSEAEHDTPIHNGTEKTKPKRPRGKRGKKQHKKQQPKPQQPADRTSARPATGATSNLL
jgi:hypothetical protein